MSKYRKEYSHVQVTSIADMLHHLLCKDNNPDTYNWYADVKGGDKSTRERYMKKAASVLEIVSYKTAIKVLTAIKS